MEPSLIPAILTYVRDKGGYTTKTKLLKLLYLIDIDSFRERQSTLTGFKWIFYKYGPWASDYDEVLERAQGENKIRLTEGGSAEFDTMYLDSVNPVGLAVAFPKAADELRVRRIIEAWADRPTAELLDYVYFHTAPMHDAQRGDPLDFSSVLQEHGPVPYKRTQSTIDAKERKKRQAAFREALNKAGTGQLEGPIIGPRYDADFWRAVETLDKESD